MTAHTTIAGLSPGDYAELLDSLRKDLQLDATVDILPGSILASLFDQAGRASFLQLLTAQKLQIAVGVVSLTWSASTTSNLVVVNHPIGRAPQVWFNAHDTGNAGIVPECQSSGRTTTQFSAQAVSQVSGSYSISFDWLAIG